MLALYITIYSVFLLQICLGRNTRERAHFGCEYTYEEKVALSAQD